MIEAFHEAFHHTLPMLPFLAAIFLALEWMEHRYGPSLDRTLRLRGPGGPPAAAALGCVPQCGFSAMASALYARRAVTLGTLLAAFLSTSDEAVPLMLAHGSSAIGALAPILGIKVVLAIVAGLAVDALGRRRNGDAATAAADAGPDAPAPASGRRAACIHPHRPVWRCALERTVLVFAFVLLVTLALEMAVDRAGEDGLRRLLLADSPLQPVIAALIGLVPTCASSVAITEAYLDGAIGLGATIAGLSAAGGAGILVLMRENPSRVDTLRVLALLLAVSIAAGLVVQLVAG
ncbi:MAG TPA: putative manganese transporter [Chthonomonadales bacterium]|nr:putative manganese transporter [Chthonomonadales bacterium]